MATYEATKYDFNGAAITGIQGLSTGTIIPWATASTPSGYLACNGAAVSRSTYANLFTVIGTTYGSGDGSTTFNVPNTQDNVIKSVSNNESPGLTGGANTRTMSGGSLANHTLSVAQIGSHTHSINGRGDPADYNMNTGGGARCTRAGSNINSSNTGSSGAHSHSMNSGNAVSTLQPYLVVNYIIKT